MDARYLQIAAGSVASLIFIVGTLPMLWKAARTKDLKSYSLANLVMMNTGNLLYWLYVSSLPIGPIWLLHGFSTISTLLMLVWYFRYQGTPAAFQKQTSAQPG